MWLELKENGKPKCIEASRVLAIEEVLPEKESNAVRGVLSS